MSTLDDSWETSELERPERRAVKALHRLAKIEAQVEDSTRALHAQVSSIYGGVNDEVSGRANGVSTLSVSTIDVVEDHPFRMTWSVRFRGRPILFFVCTPGYQSSPRPVIARCDVRERGSSGGSLLTLYLTRENGGVHWEVERDDPDEPTLLGGGDMFIKIITGYADRSLTRYQQPR